MNLFLIPGPPAEPSKAPSADIRRSRATTFKPLSNVPQHLSAAKFSMHLTLITSSSCSMQIRGGSRRKFLLYVHPKVFLTYEKRVFTELHSNAHS